MERLGSVGSGNAEIMPDLLTTLYFFFDFEFFILSLDELANERTQRKPM